MKQAPDRNKMAAHVAIVLMEPKYPENIGAAARAAMNMGFSRLVVVREHRPEREKMLKMATHNASHIIDTMEYHTDLASALSRYSYIVGTTARQGRGRRNISSPRDMVDTVLPLLPNNEVALLFGPEHRGLTNEDLSFCNLITTIPTADFSSLNLAQAVAIHCYELYSGILSTEQGKERMITKLAESHELEGMYDHVEMVLKKIGFLKHTDYDYWMRSIRHFLGRYRLRSKEVRVIRGFCRQFLWHEGQPEKTVVDSADNK